ncbi:hypothetical protein LA303_02950 [Candidatus Sulfidibacterium hydrothermale]|uniref:hypothetical protein n=1 Tax=Candidatus Sulfidibacterium hydrothermale TaxID=2875962 RepID=UPI001F0AA512|nr:hypothetical protein [Candidatus Sulfidibacterium hydrothermale]UBM62945.1 hypothetical protein LA303_02950 [Candidatus Sulfidibacterium hydrothermale]
MSDPENQQDTLLRIKEILFGEELQGVNDRLSELRNELLMTIKNQFKTLDEKLDKQASDFDAKIETIKKQLAEEAQRSTELHHLLDDTDKKFQEKAEENLRVYEEKLKNLKEEAQQQQDEIRASIQAVKEEMMKWVEKLEDKKVNKAEIAELFGMMIQKLK